MQTDHVQHLMDRAEAEMQERAGLLAKELLDVAEHGVDSFYFRASGIIAERGSKLDSLCSEYATLERLHYSLRDLSEPIEDVPEESENHDEFKAAWSEIHEELAEWASRREYKIVQRQIELIDHQIEERDWSGIERALSTILEDLDQRASRKYVKRYRVKVRQMIALLEEAE